MGNAARVIFPFPAIFMPLRIDFCSQACLSSRVAWNMSHSSNPLSVIASTSLSHKRFAPGTSPYTRLKSPAQSSYRAGDYRSHSTINFCHSVSHFSRPVVGQSTYLAPRSTRCLARTVSFIWASVGLVEIWIFIIQFRTDLSTRSRVLFDSTIVLSILLRSFDCSAR